MCFSSTIQFVFLFESVHMCFFSYHMIMHSCNVSLHSSSNSNNKLIAYVCIVCAMWTMCTRSRYETFQYPSKTNRQNTGIWCTIGVFALKACVESGGANEIASSLNRIHLIQICWVFALAPKPTYTHAHQRSEKTHTYNKMFAILGFGNVLTAMSNSPFSHNTNQQKQTNK